MAGIRAARAVDLGLILLLGAEADVVGLGVPVIELLARRQPAAVPQPVLGRQLAPVILPGPPGGIPVWWPVSSVQENWALPYLSIFPSQPRQPGLPVTPLVSFAWYRSIADFEVDTNEEAMELAPTLSSR